MMPVVAMLMGLGRRGPAEARRRTAAGPWAGVPGPPASVLIALGERG